MKEAYVFFAAGFEEIEALTAVDVMRRGGMNVKTVSITTAQQVTGAHGVTVNTDLLFADTDFSNAEWLVLPGGMPGATNLYEFAPLQALLSSHVAKDNGMIAAICAAPAVVLGQLGMLKGVKATCYPGFEGLLEGAEVIGQPVEADGKYVLGNGPANALRWALKIVEVAEGADKSSEVAAGMLA